MGLLIPRTGPFHRIGNRYATMFDLDHFLGRSAFEDSWMTQPPRNILTNENKLEVQLAMPGFSKDEITIELRDGYLYISAKRAIDKNETEYIEKEVPDAIEDQVIELSEDVDESQVSAKLKNGMLIVTIPKSSDPKKFSRTITVV